jgi:hypothetical protein
MLFRKTGTIYCEDHTKDINSLCVCVGHGSWLQTRRSGFDSRRYQIFWEVMGLERGPLSLVRIIEELVQGNSGSGLENRN